MNLGLSRGRSRFPALLAIFALLMMLVPVSASAQDSGSGSGAATLTGSVTISADNLALFSEPYVVLSDLSSLTSADSTAPSVPSQISTGLVAKGSRYTFSLSLPIAPQGEPVNVVGKSTSDDPQVYAIDVVSNVAGAPSLTNVDYWGGSPTLLSSVGSGSDGNLTGQVAVWSDGNAQFPSDAGNDGQALTNDDGTTTLDAGWTIVDISHSPYKMDRDAEVSISWAQDAISDTDFSGESYTKAFDDLYGQLKASYPFTDYKHIDFTKLRSTYRPKIEQAEQDKDQNAFALAMYQFGLEFGDGHVSASFPIDYFRKTYSGGYGMTVGRDNDGNVWVTSVDSGGPADKAGIAVGDQVTQWDNQDIGDAIDNTPLALSASSDWSRADQRVRLLTRAEVSHQVSVEYVNADGDTKDARLRAVRDVQGFIAALSPANAPNEAALPIEVKVLPSGVGYIRITTFETDAVLFTHEWDYALRTFQSLGVDGLVIDVRANGGGLSNLAFYASASFNKKEFTLDTAYVANSQGKFVNAGGETVPVAQEQWDGPVAVLVDGDCASSCEQFAATLDDIPRDNISIVGETPSAGVYAAIQVWSMPDGVTFQAPFVRYENNGDIFLESQGVSPDVTVPVTEQSLTSPDDEVLQAGEDTVLGNGGAPQGTPEALPSPPAN